MIRNFLILLVFMAMFVACGTDNNGTRIDISTEVDTADNEKPLDLSETIVENMINKVSSPVETAALIKESGRPFTQGYLCDPGKAESFNTNFKRALNLGVLGADLGYLNMYQKTGSVLSYISAIHSISEELKVSQFFDFSTLKRLATNSTNLDSLMYISVSSFSKMDEYLRENERGNISLLVVTGVWLEGLYLACQVEKDGHMKQIAERIGEQKIIIDELVIVLKNYEANENFKELIAKVEEIRKEYEHVRIYTEYSPPEMVEKDGVMTIIQNEISIVEMTDEVLAKIIKKTEEVRSFVVNI